MLVYAVDLGTTNVKVVLYDEHLRQLAVSSAPAVYQRAGDRVEFSAAGLLDLVVDLVGRCAADAGDTAGHDAVVHGETTSFLYRILADGMSARRTGRMPTPR